MKHAILICAALALSGLAGCGVDGKPTRPRATTNIGVGDKGVRVGTRLGTSIGGVNIGVGHVF